MEGKFCHGRTNALCHSARGLESTASLCREFGVSRKTGFKILGRYEECGVEGFSDPGRRPHRYINQLPEPAESSTVQVR